MALDRLLSVLTLEADAEVTAVLAEARAEAATLRTRTEAEVEARRTADTRRWEEEREQALALTLVDARRRARDAELVARDHLLVRVLGRAAARLPAALARPEFQAGLPGLLGEALEALGDRPAILRAPPVLVEQLAALTRGRAQLELRADPAVGSGFVLASTDGALVIDATLEQRLAQLAPRLRQDILARLKGTP